MIITLMGRSLSEINEELRDVLSQTEFSRDSLQKAYDELSLQYQAMYEESETLRLERSDALRTTWTKESTYTSTVDSSRWKPTRIG